MLCSFPTSAHRTTWILASNPEQGSETRETEISGMQQIFLTLILAFDYTSLLRTTTFVVATKHAFYYILLRKDSGHKNGYLRCFIHSFNKHAFEHLLPISVQSQKIKSWIRNYSYPEVIHQQICYHFFQFDRSHFCMATGFRPQITTWSSCSRTKWFAAMDTLLIFMGRRSTVLPASQCLA